MLDLVDWFFGWLTVVTITAYLALWFAVASVAVLVTFHVVRRYR